MPDGQDWFAQNAPKKDWFTANAPSVQTPDPTKPDPTATPKALAVEPLKPYGSLFGLPPKAEAQRRMSAANTDEGMLSHAKTAAEIGGSIAGGSMVASGGTGLLPVIMRMLGAGSGATVGNVLLSGDPKEALKTGGTFAALEGGGELLGKGAGKVVSKVIPKVDSLAKINKLLGVEAKEVIPGKTPVSLDEFAANPARGAKKYGLDETKLSKMNALERNAAIMQARDKAGQSLQRVLEEATQAGKQVNIQDVVNETFSEIADEKLAEQAEKRMLQIMDKAGVAGDLRHLTPMQARTIQRGLDNFAKFANESEAKSFGDIADQLRTGISRETRKVVPASAEFDRDYTDLVRASNATQKTAKEFATTVPENKLRKWLIRGLIAGGLGAAGPAGYEGAKHWSTPVP